MLKLQDKLDAFRVSQQVKIPEKVRLRLAKNRESVRALGMLERCLIQGRKIPDFCLLNQNGHEVCLKDLLKEANLVLSFFRGAWCNYDGLELEALQASLKDFKHYGGCLIAISPSKYENLQQTHQRFGLDFDLLYDQDNRIAEAFGIGYTLPQDLQDIYEAYGLDIASYNGDGTHKLPLPATYIIGKDQRIASCFIDVDHTRRQEPEDILRVLRQLQSAPNGRGS